MAAIMQVDTITNTAGTGPVDFPKGFTTSAATQTISSTNYTITATDGFSVLLVTTGASDRTMTLPAAASSAGRMLNFKKVDSGVGKVIIDTPGAETIDGAAQNRLVTQNSKVTIYCDGANWFVVDASDWVASTVAGVAGGTTGADATITSISVPEGEWDLSANIQFNQTFTASVVVGALSATATTASATGGDNKAQWVFGTPTSNTQPVMSIPTFRVRVTTATTYFMITNVTFSAGSYTVSARLSARRVG